MWIRRRRGVRTASSLLALLLVAACSSSSTPTTATADVIAPRTGAGLPNTVGAAAPSRAPTSTAASGAGTITTAPPLLGSDADAYLREALSLMRTWSINRDVVDWESLEQLAYRVADGAETPAETHGAIITVLRLLHDDHSTFFRPSEADDFGSGPASFDEPVVELRSDDSGHDDVGYVSIGRYIGDVGDQADAFAAALAGDIAALMPAACGWIVDLRFDSGGNMWPMIAGLAPLLGEGEVGSFVYPDGQVEPWVLREGVAYWVEMPMVTYGVEIPADQPPVAVLVGSRTGSAGEATTVAFRSRPHTRLFGQPTAGLTTSNEPLTLSDGAILMLTMSVFTDRVGHSFGQGVSVQPDVVIGGDPTEAALEWLRSQPSCRA